MYEILDWEEEEGEDTAGSAARGDVRLPGRMLGYAETWEKIDKDKEMGIRYVSGDGT